MANRQGGDDRNVEELVLSEDEDNNNEEQEQEEQQGEPPCKRIRSSDTDLKITLKFSYGSLDDQHELKRTKEYLMYSQHLSYLSKFIDTSLSVEMKEKATKEIVFQDVAPSVFEEALKFQQDATAIRSMTAADAVSVAEFYDKYEFTNGIRLCDDVLFDYLKKHNDLDPMTPPEDLDLLVESALVAYKLNLPRSKTAALDYLQNRLSPEKHTYCSTMFSITHIEKLHPIFIDGVLDDSIPHDMTKEEVASPLFARYYVTMASDSYGGRCCQVLEVTGTGTGVDGIYRRKGQRFRRGIVQLFSNGAGERKRIYMLKPTDWDCWCIVGVDAQEDPEDEEAMEVLWKCPHSGTLEIPPKRPWKPVAEEVQFCGSPVVCRKGDA